MVFMKQIGDGERLSKNSIADQSKCSWPSLPGIKIPIYRFGRKTLEENLPFGWVSCTPEEEQSILDSLLLAQWEDRMWKGLFRYDVTASEIKVVGDKRKFLAQLNEGWDVGYFPDPEMTKLCHESDSFAFDCIQFHEELLFCVASGEQESTELIPAASLPDNAIMIVINADPVEYGHVFLVPCGLKCLQQCRDARSLEMILRICVEINNCSFCVFYDCATPTAPWQHFQGSYFPNRFPVELMPVVNLYDGWKGGIQIFTVTDYPIKTLLFESNNLQVLVEVLGETFSCLHDKDIPYTLIISDCGKKIFLFPQLPTLEKSCNLSAWECGGYFLFKSRDDFADTSEEVLVRRLAMASLDDKCFRTVKDLCCSIASKFAS